MTTDSFWQSAYYSDLQTLYALLVVPLAFLAFRLAVPTDESRARIPAAARFVAGLTLFFAVTTMIDPIATGKWAKIEGIAGTWMATAIPFFFVLLGDLRVLLLAIGVARPERTLGDHLKWAIAATLIVPCIAGPSYWILGRIVPDLHNQALWMIYEAGFLALCVALSRYWLPRLQASPELSTVSPQQKQETTSYLRALFGYSAAYYALWLIADCLIVIADLDLGWAVRVVPNQLYYAFWVPFAYWRFFSAEFEGASGKAAR